MSNALIRARVQTLLQAMTEFDDADVTLGNFRVLDSGSAPYAVIYPGGFQIIDRVNDGAETLIAWRNYVEIFATFLDDSYENIDSIRQAVIERLLTYPTLNALSGVVAATVSDGDDVRYLYAPQGDVPQFVYVRLTHVTTERVKKYGSGEF